MSKIKVFIIDPHVLVRQTITNIIRDGNEFSVVGCSDGEDETEVLKTIESVKPDALLIGIDESNSPAERLFGKLREKYPGLPVIVLTPLNKPGSQIALHSIKKGAVDFITKPERSRCLTFSTSHLAKRVIPVLQSVRELNMKALQSNPDPTDGLVLDSFTSATRKDSGGVEMVVIGGCTGGVRSLYKIVPALPADFPVPVLVVQHMPKIYSETLAKDLNRYAAVKVSEAKNNSVLMPGTLYIAPGGYHTIIKSAGNLRNLSLYRGPKVHRSRPSIDVLFWSAAQVYRDRTLGILLSGGGEDGIEGAKQIIESGGRVITESKATCALWKLPMWTEEARISEGSFDAGNIASEICRRVSAKKHGEPVSDSGEPISAELEV